MPLTLELSSAPGTTKLNLSNVQKWEFSTKQITNVINTWIRFNFDQRIKNFEPMNILMNIHRFAIDRDRVLERFEPQRTRQQGWAGVGETPAPS